MFRLCWTESALFLRLTCQNTENFLKVKSNIDKIGKWVEAWKWVVLMAGAPIPASFFTGISQ